MLLYWPRRQYIMENILRQYLNYFISWKGKALTVPPSSPAAAAEQLAKMTWKLSLPDTFILSFDIRSRKRRRGGWWWRRCYSLALNSVILASNFLPFPVQWCSLIIFSNVRTKQHRIVREPNPDESKQSCFPLVYDLLFIKLKRLVNIASGWRRTSENRRSTFETLGLTPCRSSSLNDDMSRWVAFKRYPDGRLDDADEADDVAVRVWRGRYVWRCEGWLDPSASLFLLFIFNRFSLFFAFLLLLWLVFSKNIGPLLCLLLDNQKL